MTELVIRDKQDWVVSLPDAPTAEARRSRALVTGLAVDDATGRALTVPLSLLADHAALRPVAPGGGAFGWTGRAEALWGNGAAQPVPLRLEIAAPGFLTITREVELPAQPLFPDQVSPHPLGVVALHPVPVHVAGQVLDAAGAPLAGATVTPERLWHRRADHLGAASPGTIGALAALSIGPRRHRAGPGVTASRRDATPTGASWELASPVLPGEDRVIVLGAAPFVPGSDDEVLLFERPGHAPEALHVVTATALPGTARTALLLRHPLAHAYGAGHPVAGATLAVPGPASAVQHGTERGDRCLCLADGAALSAPGDFLQISGGGPAPELCAATPVTALTGPDGTFRLPPLHRAAIARLAATHPGQATPVLLTRTLAPGQTAIQADFRFTP